jgi:mRNA-degrading endonuclease RelE of RelBE toxin-antitoxin system
LAKIPRDSARRITRAIREVSEGSGNPTRVRKLTGKNLWRLKVGGLRVIYKMESESTVLLVVKIEPRGDIYK